MLTSALSSSAIPGAQGMKANLVEYIFELAIDQPPLKLQPSRNLRVGKAVPKLISPRCDGPGIAQWDIQREQYQAKITNSDGNTLMSAVHSPIRMGPPIRPSWQARAIVRNVLIPG